MACTTCDSSGTGGYTNHSALSYPPLNSTDILVYEDSQVREFNSSDWPSNRHKLLLLYPETNTPVCATEMGAINDWVDRFNELNCDIYSVTTDPIELVQQWYETNEQLLNPRYKALSSWLLPARLGLLHNNRAKRASVFITSEGDLVIQEHFLKVGRSLSELHRSLYGYTTNSYCAEGWNPGDGFIS